MIRETFALVACVCVFQIQAQSTPTWTSSFDQPVNWQRVTSLGNYVVQTNAGLYGIETESGNILWHDATFGNIEEAAFAELENSPFIKIETPRGLYIINSFDGTKLFNSFDHGFSKVDQHYVLYRSNTIIVAGKSDLGPNTVLSIDIATGDVLWTSEGDVGKLITVIELTDQELLGVTLLKNVRMKSLTGDIVWSVENSAEAKQLNKMGAFGDLLKQVAENMVDDMEIKLDFALHPSRDMFVIGSEQQEQSSTFSSSSEPVITYSSEYRAYDVHSGELIWDEPVTAKGQLGHMAWVGEDLLVLPFGNQNSRINLHRMSDGEGLWGKKGRGIPIKGGIYDYTATDNGMLVITTRNDKHFLNYLDTASGMLTFDKAIKVKGHVGYTITTDMGIVYVTAEEMNIVNIANGELVWDKDLKTHYHLVAQDANMLYFFNAKEGVISGVNLDNGALTMNGGQPVDFQEKESPKYIELRQNGIFLGADQNFALYSYDGDLQYHKYLPSPKEAGWKRALLLANTIYAGYYYAASSMAAGAFNQAASQQGLDTVEGQVFSEIGNAYNEMSQSAGNVASMSFKAAQKRFKATSEARDYVVVLTKGDEGIELLKMDKDSGESNSSIPLGKNRKPNYAIDLVAGEVFLEVDPKTVRRYLIE